MKPTIYETITNQIVEAIEHGAESYRMPWHHGGHDITSPRNVATGKPYRGVNVITLWMLAEARGYIASWLKVLKGDSRAIFTAANRAQQATDFLSKFAEEAGSAFIQR